MKLGNLIKTRIYFDGVCMTFLEEPGTVKAAAETKLPVIKPPWMWAMGLI